MDAFDFKDEPSRPKFNLRATSNLIWGLGTGYFLLSTVCLVAFFALTFVNPYNGFNPLPPATPLPTSDQPLPTDTPLPEVATPTFTADLTPGVPGETETETPTPDGGGTPTPTIDFPSQTPVLTSEVTATTPPAGGPHYSISGAPTYTSHINGCGGAYVAGNVTDINGNPLVFMKVLIGGTIGSDAVSEETLSGSAPQYSESGWEFKIADAPVETTGTLYVQLFNLESPDPVSDLIIFDTSDICNENVTLINFVQDQ